MNFSLNQQWHNIQAQAEQLWLNKFAPRYDTLEESEQKIIRLAAIILPIIIFVFGIALPIIDKNTYLRAEVIALSSQLNEANQLADALAANPASQTASNASSNILTQVDKLARQTGVRTFITRLRPQQVMGGSERLQTQIKDVPYQKLTDFLTALEQAGLPITQLKIQAAAVGHVQVQAVIGG